MLSKRAKYAIKTLIFLHQNREATPISAKIIAEQERIPYKFLENILRELRQNKLLTSERGAEGGYKFLMEPADITVADVVRIVDGPIALIPCVSENFYEKCNECIDEETCQIRKLFAELRTDMLPTLEKSITDLARM
ncbi:Rrf2 family transcriptional regulator [Subsaxibacter sp. CAU 1640]|uniref:RrF2 family transcriptional regulator n=1 Tax=Subsaxibacter sp. CAU 1640 TaxID=2933271 RepID=UPI00200373F3|nr:Rrf2 family transcriptional regulator [Subsaxibacter sp. CAU 1640]MCK7591746.1 Rrf2 family transcriptional regulator [Subsaxibacter sp. CAU 1640]